MRLSMGELRSLIEAIEVDTSCACKHSQAAHTRRVKISGGRVSDYGCVACKCRRFRSTAHGSDRESKSEAVVKLSTQHLREIVESVLRETGEPADSFPSSPRDNVKPHGPGYPVAKHLKCNGNVYKVKDKLYCAGCQGQPDRARGGLRWV